MSEIEANSLPKMMNFIELRNHFVTKQSVLITQVFSKIIERLVFGEHLILSWNSVSLSLININKLSSPIKGRNRSCNGISN